MTPLRVGKNVMTQTTYQSKTVPWAAATLWMGFIFYLSHQPGSASSELSSGLMADLISFAEVIIPFQGLDTGILHHLFRKSAHFFAYFILGILCFIAMNKSIHRPLKVGVWAFLICVFYAISDETHQLFIPGRSGEIRDVLIDSGGSFVGICFYLIINKLIEKFSMRL